MSQNRQQLLHGLMPHALMPEEKDRSELESRAASDQKKPSSLPTARWTTLFRFITEVREMIL